MEGVERAWFLPNKIFKKLGLSILDLGFHCSYFVPFSPELVAVIGPWKPILFSFHDFRYEESDA